MKTKYLLFCYNTCYPCGGWSDLTGCYKTIEEARENISKRDTYYHIVDLNILKVIEANDKDLYIENDEDLKFINFVKNEDEN